MDEYGDASGAIYYDRYFAPTWLGRDLTTWNWYGQPSRTNNAAESFHGSLKLRFPRKPRPNLFVQQAGTIMEAVTHDIQGNVPPPPRRPAQEAKLQRRMAYMADFYSYYPLDYLYYLTEFTASSLNL